MVRFRVRYRIGVSTIVMDRVRVMISKHQTAQDHERRTQADW